MAHIRDLTQTSSSGSISNLSILNSDDYPEGSERRFLQHARDRRRMQDAVSGDPPRVIAFRKQRPNPRIAARLEGTGSNGLDSPGSEPGSSRRSSVDLPARPASMADGEPPNVSTCWASKGRQKNSFLRRINSDGPIERPRTPEQDPDIIYKRRTAFTGDSPRSDIDFTAAAADVPLPSIEPDSPSRMRKSPLMESLRRRRTQRTSSLDLIEEMLPGPHPTAQEASTQSSRRGARGFGRRRLEESALRELDNNERLGDMPPVVASKSNKTTAVSTNQANAAAEDERKRPSARRLGSRELLRQLARASSTTPSPSPHDHDPEKIDRRPESSSPSKEKRTKPEQYDHRLPTPPNDEPVYHEDEALAADSGAAAVADELRIHRQADAERAGRSSPERSRQPKSAVEAVIRAHEVQHAEDGLGDATIASLKGLIDDEATVDLSSLLPLDGETLELINNVNVRITRGEDLRTEEREQLDRMNEYLRAARSGIRDASKGLKRVEHQVEGADGQSQTAMKGRARDIRYDDLTFSDIFRATSRSFRRQFATRSPKGHLSLTWLGLFSLILLIWSMLEITLCEAYCQPLYAYTMVGYGVNVHAPRMPFVTTTVLLKWPFGWALGPLWRALYWVTKHMINAVLGSVGVESNLFDESKPSSQYWLPPDEATGFGYDDLL